VDRPPSTKYQQPNKAYFLPVEEVAAESAQAARAEKARARKTAGARGSLKRKLGTAAAAVVLLLVCGFVTAALVLPGCIKRECIAAAAANGVKLGIQDVRLSTQGFTLVGISATADDVPVSP
jgi:hypothetical protein